MHVGECNAVNGPKYRQVWNYIFLGPLNLIKLTTSASDDTINKSSRYGVEKQHAARRQAAMSIGCRQQSLLFERRRLGAEMLHETDPEPIAKSGHVDPFYEAQTEVYRFSHHHFSGQGFAFLDRQSTIIELPEVTVKIRTIPKSFGLEERMGRGAQPEVG
jgi:hypothetical protein